MVKNLTNKVLLIAAVASVVGCAGPAYRPIIDTQGVDFNRYEADREIASPSPRKLQMPPSLVRLEQQLERFWGRFWLVCLETTENPVPSWEP